MTLMNRKASILLSFVLSLFLSSSVFANEAISAVKETVAGSVDTAKTELIQEATEKAKTAATEVVTEKLVGTEKEKKPSTNAEIRQWYNDQVSTIPEQDKKWVAEGLTVQQRAQKAYDIRHHARIQAREFMQNKEEVTALQARDTAKYGNPDGPTFEYLVKKGTSKGLSEEEAYQNIIGSANRTNAAYNKKFGVKKEGESQ